MEKIKCIPFIEENYWLVGVHGWGNGYVAVPKHHPLFGKNYSDKIKVDNISDIPFNGNFIGLMCHDREDPNNISLDLLINVHCGLTYSEKIREEFIEKAEFLDSEKPDEEYWVFGFDTCHFEDNKDNWTKEKVIEETLKLKEIIENFK